MTFQKSLYLNDVVSQDGYSRFSRGKDCHIASPEGVDFAGDFFEDPHGLVEIIDSPHVCPVQAGKANKRTGEDFEGRDRFDLDPPGPSGTGLDDFNVQFQKPIYSPADMDVNFPGVINDPDECPVQLSGKVSEIHVTAVLLAMPLSTSSEASLGSRYTRS